MDQLNSVTWLKWADARLDRHVTIQVERKFKIIRIFSEKTISNTTIEEKNRFIWLLSQEFPYNQRNVIKKEQVSIALSSFTKHKDKNLYIYYYCIEVLLIGIARRDWVTHDGENAIILNKAQQHILKDTISKFIFGLRNPNLHLGMIKNRNKLAQSLYEVFKKAEAHILILDTKLQIDKEHDFKVRYKAFNFFQTLIAVKQNICPQFYESLPHKNQFFQPSWFYWERKRFDRNKNYPNHRKDLYQTGNIYLVEDVRNSQNYGYHISEPEFFNLSKSCNSYINGSAQYMY